MNEEEKAEDSEGDSGAQYGYLGWLHKLIDLSKPVNKDIYLEKKVNVETLFEGAIVDA